MSKIFAKTWDHEAHEKTIYSNWEKSGKFKPEINPNGEKFVISMPPPNVTGKLHIGHALFVSIQDLMTRYHRLRGDAALWVPGMDHAGIATQSVVDKALRKQGINKNDLGREKFVDEVWKWKEEYGGTINKQVRAVGASCDWDRERFTLDEGLSEAVNTAFKTLYDRDLIYRGEYIVNWCPKCGTAIADDEVEHEAQKAKLYYFKYDKNFPITIATTRPETKFGDTAVAVNPKDKRYEKFIDKDFEIDLDGVKRKIKIIGDRAVDIEFGTGAVGVTPAHSMIDWKMAEDHNLPKIKVIDEHGRMTAEAGKYADMKVLEAREKLVEYLETAGLIEKTEEIDNNLSICYRCGGAIEPLPSLQWFVKMKPLAEKAKAAVESGEIKIIPKRFEKVYFHWMDNIRDWCVSRQLWWGHRLPVYYRKQEDELKDATAFGGVPQSAWKSEKLKVDGIYVGNNPPEGYIQDEDVLDTWFSSGLWPFSTLGWPNENSADFSKYFPTTVMETGYDILFFWVARMIMMSLELTGEVPFKTVYLHGLVRDEKGRKMSKSLGNSLDPLEIIDKHGADALRASLIIGTTPGQDINLGESKIKGFRNFSNKIWNASRFVALRVSDGNLQTGEIGEETIDDLNIDQTLLSDADKLILDQHKKIITEVTKNIDNFQFSMAGEALYNYFWHDFCDVYIEAAKNQLDSDCHPERSEGSQIPNSKSQITASGGIPSNGGINTNKILLKVLSESLILLHPFVPFVTEAVWQELRSVVPTLSESLITANWPK